jgi:outer membrane protein, adhesin transport system
MSYPSNLSNLKYIISSAIALTPCFSFAQTVPLTPLANDVKPSLISELNRIIPNHPSVIAANAQAKAMMAEIDVARAPGKLHAGFEGGLNAGNSLSGRGAIRSNTLAAKISLPLFDGGRVKNDVARSQLRADAQIARVSGTQRDLAAQIAAAYVDVVKRTTLLEDAKAHVDHLNTITQRMKRIAAADPGRSADYYQALSRSVQHIETQALRQAELSEAQGSYIALTNSFLQSPQEPLDYQPPQLTRSDISNRVDIAPTIQAAESDLTAEKSAFNIAKAWRIPAIVFDARLGSSVDFNNQIKYFDSPTAGFNVVWNTFDGGTGAANTQAALEKVNASDSHLALVKRELSGQMLKALTYSQGLEGRSKAAQRSQQCADQVRVIYLKQFEVARRQLLDVLNAEDTWFSQRTAAINTHYEAIAAHLRFAAVVGDLWPIDASKLNPTVPPPLTNASDNGCEALEP